MPVVTALRATRGGRVAVHLDGAYFCSVSPALLARERLYEGREMGEAEAAALRAAASAERVQADALRLLSHRARSRHELRRRLLHKGHEEQAVDEVLARLEGEGLVDDDAFARAYVADKRNLAGWGEGRIRRGLAQLGVDGARVERALRQDDDAADPELARALAVLARRPREGAAPAVVRRRALAALLRRGFAAEVASQAVRRWLGAAADDEAEGPDTGGDDT